jgi:hypothetical protein
MRKITMITVLVLLLASLFSLSIGCTDKQAIAVSESFAKGIGDMTVVTMAVLSNEVKKIDNDMAAIQTKLNKLEQVAKSSLQWIDYTKATAQKEVWGGVTVVEVVEDLVKFKNDQYQVVKLQLTATRQSAGLSFVPVINIFDLKTGVEVPYEELRDTFKKQIEGFKALRDAKEKRWNLIKSTSQGALNEAGKWKRSKLDNVTYQFAGPGLGWDNNSLTRGEWYYYTDTKKIVPVGTAAQALESLLKGK